MAFLTRSAVLWGLWFLRAGFTQEPCEPCRGVPQEAHEWDGPCARHSFTIGSPMPVGSVPAAQAFGVLGLVLMRVLQGQLRSALEGAVRLVEGKDLVLGLILAGQPDSALALGVNTASPDGDPGSSSLREGRACHPPLQWLARADQPGMVQRRLRPAGHQRDGVLLVRVRYPRKGDVPGRPLLHLRLPADARVAYVIRRATGQRPPSSRLLAG